MGQLFNDKIQVFQNIPFDVLLGLAFVVVLVTFVLFIVLRKARLINQTIAKIADLINDIRTIPVFEKLIHVANIVDNSKNLQTDYLRWRTVYEITYEKNFAKLVQEIYDFTQDKKNLQPNNKNYRKLLQYYEELYNNIYQVSLTVFDDINCFLTPERFFRDFYVKINNLYLQVSQAIDAKTLIGEIPSNSSIDDARMSINDTFFDFFETLGDGRWDSLSGLAKDLVNKLTHFIRLLDTIPQLLKEVEILIARKMSELENKYIIFGTIDPMLMKRAIKFGELKKEIDLRRIKLKSHIEKIQYLKGKKILNEIYQLINNYEAFASYEEGIQNKLNVYSPAINDIFQQTNIATGLLLKKANQMFDIRNREKQWDQFEFQSEVNKISEYNDRWINLQSQFSLKGRSGRIDFEKIRNDVVELIGLFLEKCENIVQFEDKINKSSTDFANLIDQIVIADSTLSQIDIKISQYHAIQSLKAFIHEVNELRGQLEEIRKRTNSGLLKPEQDLIENELKKIYSEIMILHRRVRDEIFCDYISQELIIYLTRFNEDSDGYEQFLQRCIAKREQGKYRAVIQEAVGVIRQIKGRKK